MNQENTIQKFLSKVCNQKIKLWLDTERNAPPGIMTPELLEQIKEKKLEIITFLKKVNTQTKISIKPI